MLKKIVFGIMVLALSVGMLALAFSIQTVKAEPRTWIVDDDGPADFHTIQEAINAASTGDTIFVKAGTYYEHVVVNKTVALIGEDKHSTILDGNMTWEDVVLIAANNVIFSNLTVQNSGASGMIILGDNVTVRSNKFLSNTVTGIGLDPTCNASTIADNIIANTKNGIELLSSSFNQIVNNTIYDSQEVAIGLRGFFLRGRWYNCTYNNIRHNVMINNFIGIYFVEGAPKNIISHNILTNHLIGIKIYNHSPNNVFYHNAFINSSVQIDYGSINIWDCGYPSGGNYWSDYNGLDSDYDGIGDTPYFIDENNQDNYPLMGMFSRFNTSLGYNVDVISNSTIEDFEYFDSNNTIVMHVSNITSDQTFGFVRICIPHALMSDTYQVLINGAEPYYVNYTLYDNGTHRWIYFSYQHSTLEIMIVPEFPLSLLLPLFMIATLPAVIVYKRKHVNNKE